MKIIKATPLHNDVIRKIATSSWNLVYKDILSTNQISYMLDLMYADESLKIQMIEKNHHFYVIQDNDYIFRAFVSFEFFSDNKTKIHKIYVLPDSQNLGLGKMLINFVIDESIKQNNQVITLNVNRNNSALHFYQKLGFEKVGEEDIDIGNGYLMEDYILEKKI